MLYDKDIREPLFDFLEDRYGKIRIIEEKRMGRSRADVVMVMAEALMGIEIKSDADTYARLKRQVKDYNRFFDSNIVAVGSTHAAHIEEHVPAWWGIITVEEIDHKVDFYMLREPGTNPRSISPDSSVVRIFAEHGWSWGGDAWAYSSDDSEGYHDYMHFSYMGE